LFHLRRQSLRGFVCLGVRLFLLCRFVRHTLFRWHFFLDGFLFDWFFDQLLFEHFLRGHFFSGHFLRRRFLFDCLFFDHLIGVHLIVGGFRGGFLLDSFFHRVGRRGFCRRCRFCGTFRRRLAVDLFQTGDEIVVIRGQLSFQRGVLRSSQFILRPLQLFNRRG